MYFWHCKLMQGIATVLTQSLTCSCELDTTSSSNDKITKMRWPIEPNFINLYLQTPTLLACKLKASMHRWIPANVTRMMKICETQATQPVPIFCRREAAALCFILCSVCDQLSHVFFYACLAYLVSMILWHCLMTFTVSQIWCNMTSSDHHCGHFLRMFSLVH